MSDMERAGELKKGVRGEREKERDEEGGRTNKERRGRRTRERETSIPQNEASLNIQLQQSPRSEIVTNN